MATLNLSINIPDGNVDTLIAALVTRFPFKFSDAEQADPSLVSPAKARQVVNDFVVEELKKTYRNYLRKQFEAGVGAEGDITE